jgi:hypothetical protein
MSVSRHHQQLYSFLYLSVLTFIGDRAAFEVATDIARRSLSLLVGMALEGRATPFGPLEHLYNLAHELMVSRGLVTRFASREALWRSIPIVHREYLISVLMGSRTLRMFSLVNGLSSVEHGIATETLMSFDAVNMRYAATLGNPADYPPVAALLSGWENTFEHEWTADDEPYQSAYTYYEGEYHRAMGWYQRVKPLQEGAAHGRTEQADLEGTTEPAQPGRDGDYDWVFRPVVSGHDEALPA